MDLMEVLLFQDRNTLKKLLRNESKCVNEHSKREMVEQLLGHLLNKKQLIEKFEQLSSYAKRVALFLCFDKKLFLSKEELYGFSSKAKDNSFTEVINELTSAGILFYYLDRNYLVPLQIKDNIIELYKSMLTDQSLFLPFETVNNGNFAIIKDLFTFIEALEEKPLPLTKSGILYKKDFQSIMTLFSYKEALPNEKWRFGYGRRFAFYPNRFSLIYDFCFHNNWITESEGYLKVTKNIETFYELKVNEFVVGIVDFWLKLYTRPIPSIRIFYSLMVDLIEEVECFEEEGLVSILTPLVERYYFDNEETIIKKRFLKMLVNLDVLQFVQIGEVKGYSVGPAYRFLRNC